MRVLLVPLLLCLLLSTTQISRASDAAKPETEAVSDLSEQSNDNTEDTVSTIDDHSSSEVDNEEEKEESDTDDEDEDFSAILMKVVMKQMISSFAENLKVSMANEIRSALINKANSDSDSDSDSNKQEEERSAEKEAEKSDDDDDKPRQEVSFLDQWKREREQRRRTEAAFERLFDVERLFDLGGSGFREPGEPVKWTKRKRHYHSSGRGAYYVTETEWKDGAYHVEILSHATGDCVYSKQVGLDGLIMESGSRGIGSMLPAWHHHSNKYFVEMGQWKYE